MRLIENASELIFTHNEVEAENEPEQVTTKPTPGEDLINVTFGSFEDYRNSPGLNFHMLKDFLIDPKAWKSGYFEREFSSPEMEFGTQFHELLLQGVNVYRENNAEFIPPVNPKTGEPYGAGTKAAQAYIDDWKKANPGKRPITKQNGERIISMIQSVRENFVANEIFFGDSPKMTEFSIHGKYCGIEIKGSIDLYSDQFGIVDLKTTKEIFSNTGYNVFQKTARDFRYYEQLAFYSILVSQIGLGEICPVNIVAVETVAPFRVYVETLSNNVLNDVRKNVHEAIKFYIECNENNSYPSRSDGIFVVDKYLKKGFLP